MKIGRNDPCPCGSGLKYKRCCLNKSDTQKMAEAVAYSLENIKRESRIKQCLHPNKSECNGKIIKAHAIQNNRILNKIAVDGMLITLDGTEFNMFQTSDKKGRGVATTFTGFCQYHDKHLFQEIEDKDFVGSEKQIFLMTYRTLAWHFHKKQEQANSTCIQIEKMFEKGYDLFKSEDFSVYFGALKMGLSDNMVEKRTFDEALLEEEYDVINYSIWEIPYMIEFAISMMNELEHDIYGNRINDMESAEPLKNIYLNIFPSGEKSYCIWSWLKIYDEYFIPFTKQFADLEEIDRKNYLNNNIPRWSDSVVISPRLWSKWGKQVQQALIAHANFDVLFRQIEDETNMHSYEYMDTPWDFFDKRNSEL